MVDNKKADPMGIIELVKQTMIEEAVEDSLETAIDKGWKKGAEEAVEKGIQIGWEHGLDEGMEKGMEKGMALAIQVAISNILKKYPTMSDEELAGIFPAPITFIKGVRKELEQNVPQKLGAVQLKRQRKKK